jgi:hypothetical protein
MLDDSVREGWIRSPVIMIDASAGIELHLRDKGFRAGRESHGHSREPSCVRGPSMLRRAQPRQHEIHGGILPLVLAALEK